MASLTGNDEVEAGLFMTRFPLQAKWVKESRPFKRYTPYAKCLLNCSNLKTDFSASLGLPGFLTCWVLRTSRVCVPPPVFNPNAPLGRGNGGIGCEWHDQDLHLIRERRDYNRLVQGKSLGPRRGPKFPRERKSRTADYQSEYAWAWGLSFDDKQTKLG